MPTDLDKKIHYFKLLLKIIIMIVQIDILDQDGETRGTIKKSSDNTYYYEHTVDQIYGMTIKQTKKGVWVNFRLLYIGNFEFFLSNKNINIIEE